MKRSVRNNIRWRLPQPRDELMFKSQWSVACARQLSWGVFNGGVMERVINVVRTTRRTLPTTVGASSWFETSPDLSI